MCKEHYKVDMKQYLKYLKTQLKKSNEYEGVWQQFFNHELSSLQPRYDLLGYDQTRHLLHLLQNSTDSIAAQVWYGTQADIQYHQVSPDGGYENQQIHIIRK